MSAKRTVIYMVANSFTKIILLEQKCSDNQDNKCNSTPNKGISPSIAFTSITMKTTFRFGCWWLRINPLNLCISIVVFEFLKLWTPIVNKIFLDKRKCRNGTYRNDGWFAWIVEISNRFHLRWLARIVAYILQCNHSIITFCISLTINEVLSRKNFFYENLNFIGTVAATYIKALNGMKFFVKDFRHNCCTISDIAAHFDDLGDGSRIYDHSVVQMCCWYRYRYRNTFMDWHAEIVGCITLDSLTIFTGNKAKIIAVPFGKCIFVGL